MSRIVKSTNSDILQMISMDDQMNYSSKIYVSVSRHEVHKKIVSPYLIILFIIDNFRGITINFFASETSHAIDERRWSTCYY